MSSDPALRAVEPHEVEVFTCDLKVKREFRGSPFGGGFRKSVSFFSDSSKRRLLFVSRNSGHYIKSQFCLTYHNNCPVDGSIVKKHLNSWLTLLREKKPKIRYLWCLEFQGRGVPHFHVFLSVSHKNKKFRMFMARTWNSITSETESHLLFHQDSRNFREWRMVSGQYLVKEYLAKAEQKEVPEHYQNVGRFWGHSRTMKPVGLVVSPGEHCSFQAMRKAVRIVTKRYEKLLKKYVKRNFRDQFISYSLPHMTNNFVRLLEYYNYEEQFECVT
jgi:hypothetical protein